MDLFTLGLIHKTSSDCELPDAGSKTQPVYFSEGKPVACTYTLGKSVPSNAVFTDTVYTLPKATTSALGGVMIDGSTITMDSRGKISASSGGAKLLVSGYGRSFTFTGSYNLFYYIIISASPANITNSSGIVENNSTTKLGQYNNANFNMTISSNSITFSGSLDVRMKLYAI